MKARFFVSSLVLAALFLFSSYTFYPNGGDKGEILIKLMMKGMEYYHYQPQSINDDFSVKVFNEYLERLDYNKRFLTNKDVENLNYYQDKIDDEIRNGSFEFFELSSGMITHRQEKAREYCENILSQPFDFNLDEEINTDVEKMDFAENEEELEERWRLELKYRTLSRVVTSIERQEKKKEKGEEFEEKSFAEIEADAREKVLKNFQRYFDRVEEMDENDRRSSYINSIANIYDPHTSYFPPKDKEDFDIDMSGRFEGIGASLREENGYIKVVRIIPGSASSRQGDLKPNDLIVKVAQGKDEPVDVVGMDMDDAIDMIRGPKGTEVRLTVQKPDGAEKVIPIVRDIVELEETYAKSTIIVDKNSGTRMGFIHLPKFYADFNGTGGRNCADDIAIELKKLKESGVDGVTLDLRNNGGGSLGEVIDMVGLFIEKGPVVQVKSRDAEPRIMADRNPSVVYDGPLVVMVNSFSASASEILAAAIQDYGRGLVVGSASTFGKGTVQRFLNLDDFIRGETEVKPLGQIKLTMQKFYRINGGATQLKGVIPDIVLPDEYNLLETGEKDYEYSMEWDEIPAVRYKSWDESVQTNLNEIQQKSAERVSLSPTFQLIEQNAARYKERNDRYSYPLNLEEYRSYRAELDADSKKYEDIKKKIDEMEIKFLPSDESFIRSDTTRFQRYENWHKTIEKDAYVFETLQILGDLD